jgi:hypothetical protein
MKDEMPLKDLKINQLFPEFSFFCRNRDIQDLRDQGE